MRFECIYCGVRDEKEFHCGGQAHIERPSAASAAGEVDEQRWAQYLFFRANPAGWHYERWCHRSGCGRWFHVARHTLTHEVGALYPIQAAQPPRVL